MTELNTETISHRVIVANVDRVAETKHCISEAFEVGLPVSEVSGGLFQPLTEPLSVLCGPSIGVCGHNKHADGLTSALNGEMKTMEDWEPVHLRKHKERIYL